MNYLVNPFLKFAQPILTDVSSELFSFRFMFMFLFMGIFLKSFIKIWVWINDYNDNFGLIEVNFIMIKEEVVSLLKDLNQKTLAAGMGYRVPGMNFLIVILTEALGYFLFNSYSILSRARKFLPILPPKWEKNYVSYRLIGTKFWSNSETHINVGFGR